MSKKNVNPIISGMGFGISILQTLDEERQALGVSDEEFHKLATPEGRPLIRKFAEFLAEKTPKVITKNQNGHPVLTLTGLDLTGAEEVARLKSAGFHISDYARGILTNGDYDKNHRLEAKQYQIVLVPGAEIPRNRTTANVKAYAKKFGYLVPKAGIVPRIRETISDKQMEEMGTWYVVALHVPIKDSGGDPCVLISSRSDDGLWVGAAWDDPEYSWVDDGAFAFLVSQV